MLAHLLSGALKAGYDVVACPSPMAPDRLEHLLIPQLSLAFLSSSPAHPYPGKAYRRLLPPICSAAAGPGCASPKRSPAP